MLYPGNDRHAMQLTADLGDEEGSLPLAQHQPPQAGPVFYRPPDEERFFG